MVVGEGQSVDSPAPYCSAAAAEDPDVLDDVGPCRTATEQKNRAERHADDGRLIGTAAAELGLGVVDKDAGKQVGECVNDLTGKEQNTDGADIDAKRIAGVNGKVVQNDDIDPCL